MNRRSVFTNSYLRHAIFAAEKAQVHITCIAVWPSISGRLTAKKAARMMVRFVAKAVSNLVTFGVQRTLPNGGCMPTNLGHLSV